MYKEIHGHACMVHRIIVPTETERLLSLNLLAVLMVRYGGKRTANENANAGRANMPTVHKHSKCSQLALAIIDRNKHWNM